jgi:hypothetical protein
VTNFWNVELRSSVEVYRNIGELFQSVRRHIQKESKLDLTKIKKNIDLIILYYFY